MSLKHFISAVLMAASIMAAVLPVATTSEDPIRILTTVTTTIDPVPSPTVNCDHEWCQNGISICLYWAGVTGWDPSLGPIPGETFTTIGSCAMPTTTAAIENMKPRTVHDKAMLITPIPTATVSCQYQYCNNSTQYCMYWAGMTSYDIWVGPVPGMVRTTLGPCQAPASVSTASTRSSTQSGPVSISQGDA